MRKMVLLNVGPVMISEKVRKAMLGPDLCHRHADFTDLLRSVLERLTVVHRGNRSFASIILGGSGTASLEAVISSVVRKGRLLVLSNGYYGDKIEKIARIHKIGVRTLRWNWGERIEESGVERILKSDSKINYVAMVHNETSTGMLNPIGPVGDIVSKNEKMFIVDAISSIGAEDLDVMRDNIDFCVGSPNKCIESVPGLSFVCADREKLESLKGLPPRTSYLDLYNHFVYEEGLGERIGTPFTPPVQVLYALNTALDILLKEGIENRRKRYYSVALRIRNGLGNLGFKFFLPPEYRCNSLTSIITPKNVPYETLRSRLEDEGFVIYAGQGVIQQKTFRIGNMGILKIKDIRRFLSSISSVLNEINERPCYS